MKPVKVYADTSVYGGVFDEEFAQASKIFFNKVKAGRFQLFTSILVSDELEGAPEEVRAEYGRLKNICGIVDVTEEALDLQKAYLDAGILGPGWELDALHVALASVAGCRLIVSWNFKHIVNYQKIPRYNGINMAEGYEAIGIHTPSEVIEDEE